MQLVIAFVFLLILIPSASGVTPIDLLNTTVFNGDWDEVREQSDDICICQYPGRLYVVSWLSSGRDKKDRMCYSVDICEYWNCEFIDCDDWGSVIGCRIGEWMKYMPDFMIYERVWNRQSDEEKAVIVNESNFKGVCPNDWHAYKGDPSIETTVQNHKHIWADPKIRFEKTCVINDTTYIPSIKNIYIDENVWDSIDEIDYYRNCKKCDAWSPHFDSINVTNSTVVSGNEIVATVHVVLKWYYYRRDCYISGDTIICYDQFKNTTERTDFIVRAPIPTVMHSAMLHNLSAEIWMYNNTFSPYTIIDVNVPDNATATTFKYKGFTAKNFKMIGVVDNKTFTVQYMDESMWKESPRQNTITHIDELCVIHEAPINFSDLLITVSSPYENVKVTNYSVTMINSKPTDYLNAKKLLMHIIPMCILLWGTIVNVRRWIR